MLVVSGSRTFPSYKISDAVINPQKFQWDDEAWLPLTMLPTVQLSAYKQRGIVNQVLSAVTRLRHLLTASTPAVLAQFRQLRIVGVMFLLSVLLSGCIQYDVGLHFDSPNRGEIVQHIEIGERFRSFSDTTINQWLETVDRRTRNLGGRVERLGTQERVVTIPFSNHKDLAAKFNQFFSAQTGKASAQQTTSLPEIESHLELTRNNFLLLERNHLRYDLDLRSLGVLSSSGNVLISPGSLIDLEFRLETPWGARSIIGKNTANTDVRLANQQLVWTLIPGAQNHIEAVFWMPSPLGIGTVAIALLVLGGQFLKSWLTPKLAELRNSQTTP